MKCLILVSCAMLSACSTVQGPPKTVTIPVAVPCAVKAPPTPQFADTDEAVRKSPDIFELAKLRMAGKLQRDARIAELEAANAGCR